MAVIGKVAAVVNVLRKGNEVGNPRLWKSLHAAGAAIAALLLALQAACPAFGYEPPIKLDVDQADAAGLGLAFLIDFVLVFATSGKVGLLPAKEPVSPSDPYEDAMQAEAGSNRAGPPGEG